MRRPLKVKVRLINKETEEINEHEIFMGDLPLMTATGTFVINGARASYCKPAGTFPRNLLCHRP